MISVALTKIAEAQEIIGNSPAIDDVACKDFTDRLVQLGRDIRHHVDKPAVTMPDRGVYYPIAKAKHALPGLR